MKTFKQMNKSGKDVCPICNTQDDGEVGLIGVIGTEKGNIIEAKQLCIDLVYDKTIGIIYQNLDGVNGNN